MNVTPLNLTRGETEISQFALTDSTGAPQDLTGLILHLIVQDFDGYLVPGLCRQSTAGIAPDLDGDAGTLLVTWDWDAALYTDRGTYEWTLYSENGSGQRQCIVPWSPLYLEDGATVFPSL